MIFLLTGFDCGGEVVLMIIKYVFLLLKLVFFIVPIGLIVMLSVDFVKNVTASDDGAMKKNLNVIIKRIIMCMALFLVDPIYDRCAKRDILVMTDEVQTGMGRTGTLLAGEQFGHHSDVVTLAKGIAGGLPMGACLANEKCTYCAGCFSWGCFERYYELYQSL